MIRVIMGIAGLLVAVAALVLCAMTVAGVGAVAKDQYVLNLFFAVVPSFGFAAIYASRMGLNAGDESSAEEKRLYLARLSKVGEKIPGHRIVMIALFCLPLVLHLMTALQKVHPAASFYSVLAIFGYAAYLLLAVVPVKCASLVSQWNIEDEKVCPRSDATSCAPEIVEMRIGSADFFRVAGVGVFALLFLVVVIALGWREASPAPRTIACVTLVAAGAGTLRLLWIYRPHVTRIDQSSILVGPCWSARILGRDFMFVDVKSENGRLRRLRYIESSSGAAGTE